MSTVEAARDIDILRAVVGDAKLSYFGASYGTFLGATYADLFPSGSAGWCSTARSTRRCRLSTSTWCRPRASRPRCGRTSVACVDAGSCFLGDSVDAGTRRIRELLDSVEDTLPAGGRRLTVGNAVLGIWAPLYNEDYWSMLDTALKAAFAGDGSTLLSLSDAYVSRGPDGYVDNSLEALYAVNCLDHDDAIDEPRRWRHLRASRRSRRRSARSSPTACRRARRGRSAPGGSRGRSTPRAPRRSP